MHRPIIALGFGVVGGLLAVHPGAIASLCLVVLVGIDLATRHERP